MSRRDQANAPVTSASRSAVVALLVLTALVAGGLLLVDDGFVRRYRPCDLRDATGCISDPTAVEPSAIGLTRWRPGVDLEADLGPIEPGDVIKLKLCAPDGGQEVVLRIDDTPVADLEVGTLWRQHEVITPVGGQRIRLQRHDPRGAGIDLSRLSVANTVGYATGAFAFAVRTRLADGGRRQVNASSRLLALALSPVLLLLLLVPARVRGRSWAEACRGATLALLPAAGLSTLLAGVALASPYRLTFPGRTYAALVLAPVLGALLARNLRTLATTAERTVALLAPLPLRRLVTAALRPESWRPSTARTVAAAALALFGLTALMLLPRSPFEWDEVLFLRAMDHFDVATHSPHPPGYPVFMAAGHAVNAIVGDPARSLQLASVLGAALTLLGMALTLRRLAAPRGAVAIAGVILVGVPAFAFHANVGMADALATGLACFALLACGACLTGPRESLWLVAAAALAALAMGARPQVGAALAGPGLWIVARAVRSRQWRALAAATLTGLVVSAACWIPPIAITGWARYTWTLGRYREWIARYEVNGHLPGAPLGRLADAWLVRPFGSPAMAALFWFLVVVGSVAWWRSGHRRVAILAWLGAGGYLLTAAWRLHLDACVRYVNPALPPLAILAAGVTVVRRPALRVALTVAAATLAILQMAWGAPVYLLRAREVAPVWSTLTWVRANADPRMTQVLFAGGIRPHVEYLLGHGPLVAVAEDDPRARSLPGPEVWAVGAVHWTGPGDPLHSEAWKSDRLRRLSRDRYYDCAVVRRQGTRSPTLEEPLPPGRWRLTAARTLRLTPESDSCAVRITALEGALEVHRNGVSLITLSSGARAELPLAAGGDGALELVPAAALVELETDLLASAGGPPAAPGLFVPSVAHAAGAAGTRWESDLELVNTGERLATCRLLLLPSGGVGGSETGALLPIPAGGRLLFADVVRSLFGASTSGAIAVDAAPTGLQVRGTMCHVLADGRRQAVEIPLATSGDMLDSQHPGTADIPGDQRQGNLRVNLGVANPGSSETVAIAEIWTRGSVSAAMTIHVAPHSYRIASVGTASPGDRVQVRVTTPRARVLAHLSVIDDASGRWALVTVTPAGAAPLP